MMEKFRQITGRKAVYRSAFTREGLVRHFPELAKNEGGVREILGMAEYAVEYGYYRPERDWTWSRRVNPNALTWEGFLQETQWRGSGYSFGI
jgi:hypothetical protein